MARTPDAGQRVVAHLGERGAEGGEGAQSAEKLSWSGWEWLNTAEGGCG